MSAALGSLVVSLEANIAKFTGEMSKAAYQTEQALQKMQRGADSVKEAMQGMAVGVVSGLTVNAFAGAVQGVANYADEMGKMSQRVGVAVEQLSGLTYAAGLSDVSNEVLGKGLKKLSGLMQEAAAGSKEAKKTLNELGTNETQDTNKALTEIADRFANLETGTAKTALAAKGFGEKIGPELLSFLNMGADGIREATAEAERFGLVIGKDAAAAAEKFNDNLTRLAALTKGAQASLFGDLVIGIGNATQAFLDGVREGDKWGGMIRGIQTLLTGDDRHKNNVALVDDTEKLAVAEKALVAARASGMDPRGIAAREKYVADLKESLRVTLNYRKVLDEQDAKTAPPVKTGKVNTAIFGAGSAGGGVKSDAQKLDEQAQRFVARLKEQAETFGKVGAAALVYSTEFQKLPKQYQDQAMAHQKTIDGLKAQEDATKAAMKADEEFAKATERFMADRARATSLNESNVENIRIGLMTDVEAQTFAHEMILAELQTFHDAKLENVLLANALIEKENARHQQSLVDLQTQTDIYMVNQMASSTGQLYEMMKQAGMEQTALGKIAFLTTRALGVAQIILSTNVAAATALLLPPIGLGPVAGIPFAAAIKAMGYASAGMTAGLAIAEASAEGGYDIPSGTNPVTQLHEREMVLPKQQADVIRGLATSGGGSKGDFKLSLINTGTPQRVVETRQISPDEWAMVVEDSVKTMAARLNDPNSNVSRSMSRNFATQRSR